ncbi:MAG: hypothetical protein HY248_00850 [Fimbriimonas ginsengisoli]|nr:hypothetical protein [Fimbriimonas ginsengisoli]
MHAKLKGAGHDLRLNPILRVRYDAWSALTECEAWLKLPEPFQRTFGAEELSAPSFARRWKDVVAEEEANLAALGNLRRSADLIRHLDETFGGAWNTLAREHQQLHDSLEGLKRELDVMREARYSLYKEVRELRARRSGLERAKGDHFRAAIFEKSPTKEDVARRTRFDEDLRALDHELASCRARVKQSLAAQSARVKDPELQMANESRRRIETEAELKRLSLIRQAVTTARGLVRAGQRPSAWWFPLVSPSGCWFKETVRTAEAYLEPLDEASCA